MQKMLSPVVLFVYNRPDHTKKLLESINRLIEAPLTKLFIFSDQAKNISEQDSVDMVRKLIGNFIQNQSNFAEVELRCATQNMGLANSIINGVTEIINKYGNVIVLEDDLIVSNDFLSYMNEALNFYEGNSNIWAISGYSFPMKATKDYQYDIFMCGRACSWGWATWKDRWNTVDWDVSDYNQFKHNIFKRLAFSRWGKDLPEMLDANFYNEIHSWAIRWCYEAHKQKKMTVYPVKSRIKNCGTDGSGTNFTSVKTCFDTDLIDEDVRCQFVNCEASEQIRYEFSKKYAAGLELLKRRLRWFLIRTGLIKAHVK